MSSACPAGQGRLSWLILSVSPLRFIPMSNFCWYHIDHRTVEALEFEETQKQQNNFLISDWWKCSFQSTCMGGMGRSPTLTLREHCIFEIAWVICQADSLNRFISIAIFSKLFSLMKFSADLNALCQLLRDLGWMPTLFLTMYEFHALIFLVSANPFHD